MTIRHAPTHDHAKPPISPGANQRASDRGLRSDRTARHNSRTAATPIMSHAGQPTWAPRASSPKTYSTALPGVRASGTWSKAITKPSPTPVSTTAVVVRGSSASANVTRIGRAQAMSSASASRPSMTIVNGHGAPRPPTMVAMATSSTSTRRPRFERASTSTQIPASA